MKNAGNDDGKKNDLEQKSEDERPLEKDSETVKVKDQECSPKKDGLDQWNHKLDHTTEEKQDGNRAPSQNVNQKHMLNDELNEN